MGMKLSKGAACFLCIFIVITAALMWAIFIQAANTVQYSIWNSPAVISQQNQDQEVTSGGYKNAEGPLDEQEEE